MDVSKISKNEIFCLGMIVFVVVFGIFWMVEIMFVVYMLMMKFVLGDIVCVYFWIYVVMLLLIFKFVNL